jgi:hypothetical protein
VNLSPTQASFFESLSSLRFANQVSQCELGKPKRRLKDMGSSSSSSSSNNSNSHSNAMDVVEAALTSTPSHTTSNVATANTTITTTTANHTVNTSVVSIGKKTGSRTWDGVKLKGALEAASVQLQHGGVGNKRLVNNSNNNTTTISTNSASKRAKSPHLTKNTK